jgi:hypothetical protein
LAKIYPGIEKLCDLLPRIAANDREVEYINRQALPSDAEYLLGAELIAGSDIMSMYPLGFRFGLRGGASQPVRRHEKTADCLRLVISVQGASEGRSSRCLLLPFLHLGPAHSSELNHG